MAAKIGVGLIGYGAIGRLHALCYRWIPAIQAAHRLIEAGLLGDVLGFHMRYYRSSNLRRDRPATWRFTGAGSGVLIDLGSHLIDMTLHLLGPIAAVAANTRTLIEQRPAADGRMIPITSLGWHIQSLASKEE
jgi:levoglucosan dehydrogenase